MDILVVINAIVLLVCTIPIIMSYRILPIDGTPYWLFGILFFIVFGYTILVLSQREIHKRISQISRVLTILAITLVLGGVTATAIVDRARTAPVYGVHDIILQQEAAMRYLISGKNPYKETYFGTPVEEFHYDEQGISAVNPALFHFVMPPWYLLFPFSLYFVSLPLVGFFDGRMALVLCMAGLVIVLARWFKDAKYGNLAIILAALSPSAVHYFIEGRSDVFALFWFIWSIYLLDMKRFIISGIVFGLAMASKQTVWFALPFYLAGMWIYTGKNIRNVILPMFTTAIVFLAVSLPFFLWDPGAFWGSTVTYLSGSGANSYPIAGYGLGMVLHQIGVIRDLHAYYPFIIWQLVLGIPLFVFLFRWQVGDRSTARLILSYAVFLTVIWYASRYFNNSHLGYLAVLFTIGGMKLLDERNQSKHS